MKTHWLIPEESEFIGNHKALKHKKTKELCLFGKHGEIWLAGVDKIGVLVTSKGVAKKHLGVSGGNDDEFVTKKEIKELDFWVKLIKVPKSLKAQLKRTENVR